MNDDRREMLEQAIKKAWSRRKPPQTLAPGTREAILARAAQRPAPSPRRELLVMTPAASGLTWAASVLAVVSGVFGVKALSGLALAANYMALFFQA